MRPLEILLVEDNIGDVELTREAFREGAIERNLNVVGDGEDALAYLRREGPFADATRPDLILLDLNLPRMDGREVLAVVKADDALKEIPILVLTTSLAEKDVRTSYALHANCYIAKPIDLDQFTTVVQSIDEFWLTIARLPPAGSS